jgi:hypothetical protein
MRRAVRRTHVAREEALHGSKCCRWDFAVEPSNSTGGHESLIVERRLQ